MAVMPSIILSDTVEVQRCVYTVQVTGTADNGRIEGGKAFPWTT